MNKTLLRFCLIGGISLYTSFSAFAQQDIRHFFSGTVDAPKDNPIDNQGNRVVNCANQPTYRSIDGSCNNINNFDWGAVNIPFQRVIPNDYNANTMAGSNRMNPRAISNRVFVENYGNHSDDLSAFVFLANPLRLGIGLAVMITHKKFLLMPAGVSWKQHCRAT